MSVVVAPIRVTLNGADRTLAVRADARVLDVLRDDLDLKGTRFGCGENACGACRVLVDGRAVASCDLPMWAVEGKTVVTVEGLDACHPTLRLAQAFLDAQAAQCAYCSSGMLIGAAALLLRTSDPSEAEVRAALDEHLCRCGVHNRIVRAVLAAARARREAAEPDLAAR